MINNTNFIYLLITVFLSTRVFAYQNYHSKSTADICEEVGTFCTDNCQNLALCIQPGKPPEKQKCGDVSVHQFCKETSDNTATCSADIAECKEEQFQSKIVCGQVGEFPHPFECNKTLICGIVGQEPVSTCHCPQSDQGVAVDTVGLPCRPLSQGEQEQCYRPVCSTPGEEGHVGNSPRYCYTCTDDGFMVNFCSEINIYSNINSRANEKICVPSSSTTSTSSSEPTTPPASTEEPTTPSESTAEPTIPPVPDYECNKIGETFPDPVDCHYYYRCNEDLKLERKKCFPNSYYYNGICKPGDCDP